MPQTRRRYLRHPPRGTIYISVLGMSLMIFVLGMAALLTMRIQARTVRDSADLAQARLNARSAVELGMLYIQTDPYWRNDYGNGAWFTNKATGNGLMSLSAADPISGDITATNNHPVVFTAAGMKNQAVYQTQVPLEAGPRSGSCLEVAMQSGGDLTLGGNVTLTGNQRVATNHNVNTGGGALFNANVEYFNSVGGSGYSSTPVRRASVRTMPNPTTVMNYYVANGTPIQLSSLNQSNNTNLLANPSFESSTTGWYVYSGNSNTRLQLDTSVHKDGTSSLKVSGRNSVNDVAAQDISLTCIKNGNSYVLDLPIYCGSAIWVQASLVLTTSGGTLTFSTPLQTLNANGWTDVKGTLIPTWTGTVSKATVMLTTANAYTNYNMDQVSMQDVTYPNGYYFIDRVLLSPSSNPYGSQTNSQGIYVINCNSQKVVIMSSRIVGTLVLQNCDSNSIICGSVCWEPALPNYPALITDSSITLATCATALSEADAGVNFNPPGTPYPYAGGTSNTTAWGSYPSIINGIVYVAGNLTITNAPSNLNQAAAAPTFSGNVVAGGTISANSISSTTVNYSNAAYVNPPPCFNVGVVPMWDVPGTWQRTAN